MSVSIVLRFSNVIRSSFGLEPPTSETPKRPVESSVPLDEVPELFFPEVFFPWILSLSRHSRNQTGHGLLCLDGIDVADGTTC
jgi:hypothetical protein